MNYRIVITILLYRATFCYSQSIKIPEIKNRAPPEEVNSLAEHKQYPRSIGAPSTSYNNVEETVKEVESMIKANPTLPRLTRGEILDLIENITKEDLGKNKFVNEEGNVKERGSKAIMVVMPYTPSNMNDNNMEELYTKPPVTHIIGAEPFKKTQEKTSFQKGSIKQANNFEIGTEKLTLEGYTPTATFTTTSRPVYITSTSTDNFNEQWIYTEKKTNQRRRKPPQSTTEQQKPSTEFPSSTHQPKQRRPIRRRPSTTEKHPNHRYPDEETTESSNNAAPLPSSGIRIVDAPQFSPEDLSVQENQQKNVYVKKDDSLDKVSEKQVSTTVVVPFEKSTTASPLDQLIPQHLKGVLSNIKPETPTKDYPPKTSSPATQSSSKEEEDKIKNMLASFGLLPIKSTTTTTSVPDISNVADNLTPEMRDLLMSFGLIPNAQEKPATASPAVESYNPVKAEIKPESYLSFKPLPEDYSSRHEMEELLERFGLGGSSRKRKSLPKKEEQDMNFEAVPDQYMGVLKDIGLINREGKMIKAGALVKTQEKQHVFNPVDTQYASKEELEKLNKLLDVVKQLEKLNGTVTDEDLNKIDEDNLKDLISGLSEENKIVPLDEQNAPNPVNYDHSLEKNEVKRQQNSTTTTTTTPPTTTLVSSTTAEDATPNIKDLEASFGGQADATPATEAPVPETTTRKTGFYFLVDWNTFLDIDDQKGKRVNLRFQPTVGDPKQFYSVSVP